ncbi:MAG: PEP-CTERM sorting domain-containing protein [Bdellovibrionota bacterium]
MAKKLIAAALLALLPASAFASPVVLTIGETPIVQQTDNSPCVIGNPSCNNPALFDYTLIPSNTESGSLDSPEYTVGQIRDIIGDLFVIGIDLQENDDDYGLDLFTLSIGGVVEFTFGPQVLSLQNHGNGYSDYALQGFDLSSFDANATAVFHLDFSDAQAAREQFFLAAGQGSTVPEPATASLLALGAASVIRRRKKP